MLNKVRYRSAVLTDAQQVYNWSNDPLVRAASFNSNAIKWEEHLAWFTQKVSDKNSLFLIFEQQEKPLGVVRIENKEEAVIGISIDKDFRGKKLAPILLEMTCAEFWKNNSTPVFAYIKMDNIASEKSFEKAGFTFYKTSQVNNISCKVLVKNKE